MNKGQVISIDEEFQQLKFFARRKPTSTTAELAGAFARLAEYRDGGVFIAHYAGESEWERHAQGDEVVYVVEGETCLILLTMAGQEQRFTLGHGDMFVVPRGLWHRFETAQAVKLLAITPEPTDLSVDSPSKHWK